MTVLWVEIPYRVRERGATGHCRTLWALRPLVMITNSPNGNGLVERYPVFDPNYFLWGPRVNGPGEDKRQLFNKVVSFASLACGAPLFPLILPCSLIE